MSLYKYTFGGDSRNVWVRTSTFLQGRLHRSVFNDARIPPTFHANQHHTPRPKRRKGPTMCSVRQSAVRAPMPNNGNRTQEGNTDSDALYSVTRGITGTNYNVYGIIPALHCAEEHR